MRKTLINKSKFLSLILRHKPEKIGLTLDQNGWVDVKELLKKANMDIDTLKEIVSTNDKKRFTFNEDNTKIRASQGHSINVDLELKSIEPPEFLYHGTVIDAFYSIMKEGLIKGKRQYVHLSKDQKTATNVGKRRGEPIVLTIYARTMYKKGYEFFLSNNGVWLTDKIPPEYIAYGTQFQKE